MSKYFIQKKKNHFIALLQPSVFTVVYASEVILTTHEERHWYGYFYLLQQFSLEWL